MRDHPSGKELLPVLAPTVADRIRKVRADRSFREDGPEPTSRSKWQHIAEFNLGPAEVSQLTHLDIAEALAGCKEYELKSRELEGSGGTLDESGDMIHFALFERQLSFLSVWGPLDQVAGYTPTWDQDSDRGILVEVFDEVLTSIGKTAWDIETAHDGYRSKTMLPSGTLAAADHQVILGKHAEVRFEAKARSLRDALWMQLFSLSNMKHPTKCSCCTLVFETETRVGRPRLYCPDCFGVEACKRKVKRHPERACPRFEQRRGL